MAMSAKTTQKKAPSDKSVFRKHENNKSSLNKQNSPAQDILNLHQTIGNQAVQRLFDSGFIQGKLTIGEPNDKYEQEADEVADKVMRMPEPKVQRQNEEDEEDELVQTKPIGDQIIPLVQRQAEPEEEEQIQAKAEEQIPQITPNLESQINALHGGGRQLPKETRAFFEPRFGRDFSQVQVHNDTNANQLARSINARAFTRGNDVVFGGGEYSPESSSGKRLLGHELTHVIQQKSINNQFSKQTLQLEAVKQSPIKNKVYPPVYWSSDPVNKKTYARPRKGVTFDDVVMYLYGDISFKVKLASVNNLDPDMPLHSGSKIYLIKGTNLTKTAFKNLQKSVFIPLDVLDAEAFMQKKKKLELELEKDFNFIVAKLDEWHYSDSDEGEVISKLKKWGQEKFTTRPRRYPNGGEYLDKLFRKLQNKKKNYYSYYSTIFQKFDRVKEVEKIRDAHAWLYKGESGVKEVTYGAVFVETAFQKALGLAGVPKRKIMDFINKAGNAVSQIIKHPGRFFKNLGNAVKKGFNQFTNNIGKYLKEGLLNWIFGSIGGGRITIPKDFSFKSILTLVLQIFNITPDSIRKRIAGLIGEKNLARLEKFSEILSLLRLKGISGLWKMFQQYIGDLKNKLLGAVKSWVIVELVKKAVLQIIMMFNPVSGLVKLIKAIYNIIQFLVEKAQKIKALFIAIGNSLSNIVKGNIASAANKVEEVLKRALFLAIGLLAGILDIKIVSGIRKAIKRISNPIKEAINKVVNKIAQGLSKIGIKAKKGIAKGREKVVQFIAWWKLKKIFRTNENEKHTLFFSGSKQNSQLQIASKQKRYRSFLEKANGAKQVKDKALGLVNRIEREQKKRVKNNQEAIKKARNIGKLLNQLATYTIQLSSGKIPHSVIKYGGLGKDGRATSMNAEILSKLHAKGSKPRDKFLIWKQVKRRRKKGSRRATFVQGHLLNELLGGPGKAYNLTPITASANALHESQVENPIWQLVEKQGKIVRYEVKPIYQGHKTRENLINKLEKRKEKLKSAKKIKHEEAKINLVKYENENLATKLKYTWYELKYTKNKKWNKKSGTPVKQGFIQNKLPKYEDFVIV